MSFDHWWFGLVLPDETIAALRAPFADAKRAAHLTPDSHQAITTWTQHPDWFEAERAAASANAAEWSNAFLGAFDLPPFGRLARQFCKADGVYVDLMREDTVSGFLVVPRHPPVAMLWHALGADGAGALPGLMGNMCLRAEEIADAALAVSRALGAHRHGDLRAAMRRLCGAGATDDLLEEILAFLPNGLSRALNEGQGFLALALARV